MLTSKLNNSCVVIRKQIVLNLVSCVVLGAAFDAKYARRHLQSINPEQVWKQHCKWLTWCW